MKIPAIALILTLSLSAIAQNSAEAPQKQVATMKLSGFFIARYNYTSNATPNNTFSIRTARFTVGGRVFEDFEYKTQIAVDGLTNSINGPRILDAYVEWQKFSAFRVKLGQFKRPFTFENPMNPIDQDFYRYGMAVYKLAGMSDRVGEHSSSGRDIGLQFQGDLFESDGRGIVHYIVGLFNGQGINMSDINNSKDIIGGIWVSPVKDMRIGAFGWSGKYGRKWEGQYAELKRVRYAISGEYNPGDWTFRTEYVRSYGGAFKNSYGGNLEIDKTLGDNADAWYAMMSAPIIPEVFHAKIRYDLYRDNGAWDRAYTAYDFGLDYSFTRNLKLSAIGTYVHDRRLAEGKKNYFMFDFQLGVRF